MAPRRHLLGFGELVSRQDDMWARKLTQRRGMRRRVRSQTLLPRPRSTGLPGTSHGDIIRAMGLILLDVERPESLVELLPIPTIETGALRQTRVMVPVCTACALILPEIHAPVVFTKYDLKFCS
jgi:hypothetical protein